MNKEWVENFNRDQVALIIIGFINFACVSLPYFLNAYTSLKLFMILHKLNRFVKCSLNERYLKAIFH